jgi:alpha-galactosidase
MQTNVNVQGLTVHAALTRDRDAAVHAALLDPHTAAELSMDEIARVVDALIEHGSASPVPGSRPA